VEGCVGETFGTLVAWWQAKHARDPVVARAMARVAKEQLRDQVEQPAATALVTVAGLPPTASARELLRRVEADVIGVRASAQAA
jgi:hypothetical protein